MSAGYPDKFVPNKTQYSVFKKGKTIYNQTLNQSNLLRNNNKFYIIQLLQDIDENDSFYLFTRWGRVGYDGQTDFKGPFNEDQGIREYEKKLRAKTVKGEYVMLEIDHGDDVEDDNDDVVVQVQPKKVPKKKAAPKPVAVKKQSASNKGSGSVAGKKICISGTLSETRKVLEKLLEDNGAHVTAKVSSKTDYLLIGSNPGSKLQEAQSHGVEIISEATVKQWLSGSSKKQNKQKQTVGQTKTKADSQINTKRKNDQPLKAPKTTKKVKKGSSGLQGKVICITGTLSETRKVWQQRLEASGATVAKSISKKVDIVLVGSDAGEKLEKAEELGIEVLDEDEMKERI